MTDPIQHTIYDLSTTLICINFSFNHQQFESRIHIYCSHRLISIKKIVYMEKYNMNYTNYDVIFKI